MNAQCAICQEYFSSTDKLLAMPCGHVFHENCLVTWIKANRSCPTCRSSLASRSKPLLLYFNGHNESFATQLDDSSFFVDDDEGDDRNNRVCLLKEKNKKLKKSLENAQKSLTVITGENTSMLEEVAVAKAEKQKFSEETAALKESIKSMKQSYEERMSALNCNLNFLMKENTEVNSILKKVEEDRKDAIEKQQHLQNYKKLLYSNNAEEVETMVNQYKNSQRYRELCQFLCATQRANVDLRANFKKQGKQQSDLHKQNFRLKEELTAMELRLKESREKYDDLLQERDEGSAKTCSNCYGDTSDVNWPMSPLLNELSCKSLNSIRKSKSLVPLDTPEAFLRNTADSPLSPHKITITPRTFVVDLDRKEIKRRSSILGESVVHNNFMVSAPSDATDGDQHVVRSSASCLQNFNIMRNLQKSSQFDWRKRTNNTHGGLGSTIPPPPTISSGALRVVLPTKSLKKKQKSAPSTRKGTLNKNIKRGHPKISSFFH